MKITTAQLKQIIKEEIQALTEMDEMMAFDYLEKEFGDKADLVMDLVYAAAEEFDGRPSEEGLIELFKEMGYGRDDDEPMNESIGGLMKDLGYEKARKAVASAIDFDEKVENMEDLKALIAKLRSEKDPMGRGRKEELDDIKAALRKMSK